MIPLILVVICLTEVEHLYLHYTLEQHGEKMQTCVKLK